MKVENLNGTGTLYEGERRVGKVHYMIRATTPEDASDGIGHSRGVLELADAPPGADLYRELDADKLTLHLEDGRRWDCAMEKSTGTTGHVVGDSLIYKP